MEIQVLLIDLTVTFFRPVSMQHVRGWTAKGFGVSGPQDEGH